MTRTPPTHAGPLDPLTPHMVVAMLSERMATSSDEPIDIVIAQLRAGQMALKHLCDIERRNGDLDAKDSEQNWTRLSTMKPFHPDDQAELEARMSRNRNIVFEQGRRHSATDAQGFHE